MLPGQNLGFWFEASSTGIMRNGKSAGGRGETHSNFQLISESKNMLQDSGSARKYYRYTERSEKEEVKKGDGKVVEEIKDIKFSMLYT